MPDASHKFVPVILQFSKAVDLTKATIRFKSDPGKNLNAIADPANVIRSGSGSMDDPFKYETPGNDMVRLWTKDGDQARLKAPVPTGNAILKDTLIKVSDLSPDAGKKVRLYLEAIAESKTLGDAGIKVELDPTGATDPDKFKGIASDQVKATVFRIKEVHPLANDFTSGQHKGKIMISAKQGGGYYTPAQANPGKVAITAHVEPLPDRQQAAVVALSWCSVFRERL